MKQQWRRPDQLPRGNVHELPPSAAPAPDEGSAALDLVYQAAEAFRASQERARETEAHAQFLCRQASEKLQQAEMRAEGAERAYRELTVAVDQKLKEAYRALEQAQANISAQMDKQVAAEFRAQQAEAQAREAKRALELVEEAIRRRLLTDSVRPFDRLNAVA
jgi:polyribonucleotide nucleotidyltransferase